MTTTTPIRTKLLALLAREFALYGVNEAQECSEGNYYVGPMGTCTGVIRFTDAGHGTEILPARPLCVGIYGLKAEFHIDEENERAVMRYSHRGIITGGSIGLVVNADGTTKTLWRS